MNLKLRALGGSSVVHVLFAFCAMGGWAFFANRAHAMPRPLIAGLTQGLISALLTVYLKSIIDILSRHYTAGTAIWIPPAIAFFGSSSILVLIHVMSGTPEILSTIAVPLCVSTSYTVIYNYALYRKRMSDDQCK